jgi:hypothetical protein
LFVDYFWNAMEAGTGRKGPRPAGRPGGGIFLSLSHASEDTLIFVAIKELW